MITGPDIGALIIPQRPNQPPGQRQQRRRIQYGVVYNNFIAFQYAGQDLAAQRKAVCAVQMAAVLLFYIGDYLCSLIIDGGEPGMYTQGEAIHLDGNNSEPILQ